MTSLVDLLKSKPGVQGGVGRRAVSAALAAGYTQDQIQAAASDQSIRALDKGGLSEAIGKIGTSNSNYFGDVDPAAHTDAEGNIDVAGYHAAQDAYAGGADVASMRIGGQSYTDIQSHMSQGTNQNPNYVASGAQGADDYSKMLDRINLGSSLEAAEATNRANTGRINTLTSDYNTLSGKYDALTGKYTGLQADVAQAAKDAMKIKYTGSTQVQNPSAMGIQAAQGTPFRGSGLAGTAALARPNKGLKIKTLNV